MGSVHREVIGRFLSAVSALVIGAATLRPDPGSPDVSHLCLLCGPLSGVDAVLNVLLFAPLGFGLALAGFRPWTAVALTSSYSLAIELLQHVALEGRHASVGDVVTNSLGGLLGFMAGRHFFELIRPAERTATRLGAAWLAIWLGVQVLVAYTLIPVLPEPPYYGQIARPLGNARVPFPGEVMWSGVGSESLRPGELPNAARVKTLLSLPQGARSEAVVVPGGLTSMRAEVVVVSGPNMVGVLSLEQDGGDFAFGIRTGAEALLLRAYEFRLRRVFDAQLRDTLRVYGQYGRTEVRIGAVSNGREHSLRFVPRLSLGWIPFMPFSMYIDGGARESIVSCLFLAGLILPAAYWTSVPKSHTGSAWRRRYVVSVVAFGFVLLAGLAGVPIAFGLAPAAPWEWLAVLAGAGLGVVLARRVNPSQIVAGSRRPAAQLIASDD
jgi:hypothetical protein